MTGPGQLTYGGAWHDDIRRPFIREFKSWTAFSLFNFLRDNSARVWGTLRWYLTVASPLIQNLKISFWLLWEYSSPCGVCMTAKSKFALMKVTFEAFNSQVTKVRLKCKSCNLSVLSVLSVLCVLAEWCQYYRGVPENNYSVPKILGYYIRNIFSTGGALRLPTTFENHPSNPIPPHTIPSTNSCEDDLSIEDLI